MKEQDFVKTMISERGVERLLPLHAGSNYLKVLPGGHCFFCHEDFHLDHDFVACSKEQGRTIAGSTPCPETCKKSKFYTPNFPTWVK